jgi:hypothetical protein
MLVESGIVDLLPGHRYRVHGLDTERSRRAGSASDSATARWERTRARNANASGVGMRTHADQKVNPDASQAKPSQAETEPSPPARAREDPADAYWKLTGKFPTEKTLGWVDDLSSKFGAEAVIRSLVKAHTSDRATATLLGRTQDLLRAEARELDRKEREDEQARLREKRAKPRVLEEWRQDLRDEIERRYGKGA